VDRPATEANLNSFDEKDIEMVERTEVPVVNKNARVVEEVSLGKDVNERSETINDTVRKTEVAVTDLENGDLRDRPNKDY
jgi:stress response protein YsnF